MIKEEEEKIAKSIFALCNDYLDNHKNVDILYNDLIEYLKVLQYKNLIDKDINIEEKLVINTDYDNENLSIIFEKELSDIFYFLQSFDYSESIQ